MIAKYRSSDIIQWTHAGFTVFGQYSDDPVDTDPFIIEKVCTVTRDDHLRMLRCVPKTIYQD